MHTIVHNLLCDSLHLLLFLATIHYIWLLVCQVEPLHRFHKHGYWVHPQTSKGVDRIEGGSVDVGTGGSACILSLIGDAQFVVRRFKCRICWFSIFIAHVELIINESCAQHAGQFFQAHPCCHPRLLPWYQWGCRARYSASPAAYPAHTGAGPWPCCFLSSCAAGAWTLLRDPRSERASIPSQSASFTSSPWLWPSELLSDEHVLGSL